MHIASFRIENYKSFRATPRVPLTPGFNVVVGQNNGGKTALVEALSLGFGDKPHRSLSVAPSRNTALNPRSLVTIEWCLSGTEFAELLREHPGNQWLPLKDGNWETALARLQGMRRDGGSIIATFRTGRDLHDAWLPALTGDGAVPLCGLVSIDDSGEVRPDPGHRTAQQGSPSRIDGLLASALTARIYAFDAERLNVGACRFGHNTVLRPNAANLPEVLNNLQGNAVRFGRFNRLVARVLPSVKSVSVLPRPNDTLEIVVWTVEPASERDDLAMPLSESGTGIGQVLAMLSVVLMSESASVILIDEPQSFLHPGAVRKLIEILREHPQHQFVITTHSPTALTAANPDTLLRLHVEEGQSVVQCLDATEARDLHLVLADVGARLSDVFGADAILWVEGRTEELCFPRILQHLLRRPLLGTAIVGVRHTAEFEGRRSATTIELYKRLSTARGLLPPAVGFIFDREGRTEKDRKDLERYGNVSFLVRRMYENYLLNPAAVAAVAADIEGFSKTSLTTGDVEAWLAAHRWDPKYFEVAPTEQTGDAWLREVRGNVLLSDLFAQLSEQRVSYDKVRHGAALTDWLLHHAPGDLKGLAEVLGKALATPAGAADDRVPPA